MDTTIICTLITAVSTILCAYIAKTTSDAAKSQKAEAERTEKRAELRAEEGRLQLEMLNANSQLTIGVAMALKNGHCNGEVEEGLAEVKKASDKYTHYLESLAIANLRR